MKAADFAKFDAVITTYGTLSSDYILIGKSSKKDPDRQLRAAGLYSVDWRRVVLDEGHQIRNPVSKMAEAAMALIAQSRWVLTGTPIVNALKDLYCLLNFLGISGGLETMEIFTRVLIRPLKQGETTATFYFRLSWQPSHCVDARIWRSSISVSLSWMSTCTELSSPPKNESVTML